MPRVVHFEISAEDPQRAADFYARVFGWKITKWPGPQDYWLVKTGEAPEPGIDGGIFRRHGPVGHVNSVSVASVDATAKQVEEAGGKIVVPKMAIPGVGWLIYCQDTEGSVFGLHQSDPTAK
jgi:predicted enzyme related to lactoylglutathione lyase